MGNGISSGPPHDYNDPKENYYHPNRSTYMDPPEKPAGGDDSMGDIYSYRYDNDPVRMANSEESRKEWSDWNGRNVNSNEEDEDVNNAAICILL